MSSKDFRAILLTLKTFFFGFFDKLFDAKLEHYAASLSWSTLFALIPFLTLTLVAFALIPQLEPYFFSLKSLLLETCANTL